MWLTGPNIAASCEICSDDSELQQKLRLHRSRRVDREADLGRRGHDLSDSLFLQKKERRRRLNPSELSGLVCEVEQEFEMANSTFQLIEDCEATNKALYKFYAAVVIVIFILALPLNASVLHLFIFKLKFWKSNTNNVFLFNLVLADILLLVCLPIKAYNFIQGERRSDSVCNAMLFMLFLNRGASIAFLTVTSIDRYFNVVHPGRRNFLRALKKSPQISIIIWLLLLPLTVPTMLKTFECCNSHKLEKDDTLIKSVVDSMREVVFFTQIVIPFVILVYCTARIVNRLRKKTVGDNTKLRRAVFLVTSVMVVFSVCFLPCAIARMVLLIARVQEWGEAVQDKVAVAFDGLMVLSYMDCLLDPLVYCFCSTKFKALYLTNYFPFLVRGAPPPVDSSTGNTQNPQRNNKVI
ncbi:putative hydroxycarboxylic acid receptor 2-like [Scophthalmus maximus]|uniref:Putative hydroxycarboxylic acid receptor 2-like n=1 Tax=Scophthalmus maximus TaxID=52904 RepID=A0A2U9CXK1_SCOMX|nr:putative hydroxycarboxylic acid receptor 2-like [Scophthalmus maximus]